MSVCWSGKGLKGFYRVFSGVFDKLIEDAMAHIEIAASDLLDLFGSKSDLAAGRHNGNSSPRGIRELFRLTREHVLYDLGAGERVALAKSRHDIGWHDVTARLDGDRQMISPACNVTEQRPFMDIAAM